MNDETEEMEEVTGPARKKKPAPTTQLTLRHYRRLGYEVDIAEYFNTFSNTRKDLFGFVDLVAVKEGEMLLVQTTSWSNVSSRRNKIAGIPASRMLASVPGVRIIVMGWRKNGARWEFKEEDHKGGL